jgi:hypothetical protein
MKKHSFKIFAAKSLSVIIFASLLYINTNATEVSDPFSFTEPAASVKYIGADSNTYVFNVAYTNESGERFQLRITDEAGNTLFTGTYSDKKFEKRFRLVKEDVNGKLNFTFKNLNDHSVQTFQAIATSQVVEDVVVKKVN